MDSSGCVGTGPKLGMRNRIAFKYYLKDCVECVELMNEFDDVNCEL